MTRAAIIRPAGGAARRFRRDETGASAVEFAIVALPFFMLILCIMQVGLYYMTQTSLDAGIIKTADGLRNSFTQSASTPPMPTAAALKTKVVANSGGLIANNGSLDVEIRQITSLGVAREIENSVDYGGVRSTLVLRAETDVISILPFFGGLIKEAKSSAIVRRQGY